MKLEAQFKSVNNRLCFLDGREPSIDSEKKCSLEGGSFAKDEVFFVDMPWESVGMDEDSYNEEFLASMRDMLKGMEESSAYAVIVPVASKIPETLVEQETFIASMKHSARRIKDCKSVVGYVVPDFVNADTFMEELKAKHGHYVFFSKNPDVLKDSSVAQF